ncbi:YdeI/OmpD-associated family protein [Lysobacter auxotrophicus]|uniref:YdeI/OmpD-associated family protein n=1 Tax=Lysobacter auxotrophicus TaxID=2992573 RepID=A0ABN6UKS6_9GAMM|nr:YdeI/OmpD-associated family protein [Lysobacter auxotrophicus]BDU16946.1 YdeI/OmpD-associated family protein [Lysobacter auxotrophicus]
MPTVDPRIDAYIAKSAAFAQPLLAYVREVVHGACPEVEETLKWGMPSFTWRGKILCGIAAFKQHVTLWFWEGRAVVGDEASREAMGQFGRITKQSELPGKRELAGFVKQAMARVEAGAAPPAKKKPAPKPALDVPDDLSAALRRNAKARATFDGFAPGYRRDYIEWIVDAKREDTRQRRIAQAVEWLAEGKTRNWKYMK